MRKLRKKVERLEAYVINKSLLDIHSIKSLFDEVAELKDKVEALEKGKPCECKKENEDGLKDRN